MHLFIRAYLKYIDTGVTSIVPNVIQYQILIFFAQPLLFAIMSSLEAQPLFFRTTLLGCTTLLISKILSSILCDKEITFNINNYYISI